MLPFALMLSVPPLCTSQHTGSSTRALVVSFFASASDVRLGWVWVEIDLINLHKVVLGVTTEVQWVIAGHLELFFDRDLVTAHP